MTKPRLTLIVSLAIASPLLGCGGVESFNFDNAGDEKARPVTGNSLQDDRADDDNDPNGVATSPVSELFVVDARSGDLAFDLAVVRRQIGAETIFASSQAGSIGIEDVYYGASVTFAKAEAGAKTAVTAWAIAAKGDDKGWLATSCKAQTPGPDGTVNDMCELAGPIIDAQNDIAKLAASDALNFPGDQEVLAVLAKHFPDEEFSVVASGQTSAIADGTKHQQVSVSLEAP